MNNEVDGFYPDINDMIMFLYALTDSNLNIIKKEEVFIRPDKDYKISQDFSELTGITQKDVDSGISYLELSKLWKKLFKRGTLIVGYNLTFDMTFLCSISAYGKIFDKCQYCDLLEVFSKVDEVKSHKLMKALEYYKVEKSESDALDLRNLYESMTKNYNININDFIHTKVKNTREFKFK